MTKQQILDEARSLDSRDREELIDELRQIEDGDELTPEQRAELRRRMAAMARGEVRMIDGDQAMREVREKLGYR